MSIKPMIVIASHRPYSEKTGHYYQPIQAGALGKEHYPGMLGDDGGLSISQKNPWYSELTALYYAWKNLDYTHLGLVHYRRYFKGDQSRDFPILSDRQIEDLLAQSDCIVPKKRRYFIETLSSHYGHTHYSEDLDRTRRVLEAFYPDYVPAFDRQMKKTSGHMFNMFIMKKELADQYLSFLFDVLEHLEGAIQPWNYDPFQARVLGRISELLLDVWLQTNHVSYQEVSVWHSEGQNWMKKIPAFLKAKFGRTKYGSSF